MHKKYINIVLCAKKFVNDGISMNLETIIKTIEQAEPDIDLICFGESFLQGFDCLKWDFSYDKNIAITQSSIPIVTVCKKAGEFGVAVAFGYFG